MEESMLVLVVIIIMISMIYRIRTVIPQSYHRFFVQRFDIVIDIDFTIWMIDCIDIGRMPWYIQNR